MAGHDWNISMDAIARTESEIGVNSSRLVFEITDAAPET